MQHLNTHKLGAALVLAVIAALSSFYLNVWGDQPTAAPTPAEPVVVPSTEAAPTDAPAVATPAADAPAPAADVPVVVEVTETAPGTTN